MFSHQLFIKENVICFRQQCYKCVLDSLQRLLVMKTSPSQSPGLPTQPGPPPTPDPNAMTPLDADKLVSFKLPFLIRLSSTTFSINYLPYICCNISSINLFDVTGGKRFFSVFSLVYLLNEV